MNELTQSELDAAAELNKWLKRLEQFDEHCRQHSRCARCAGTGLLEGQPCPKCKNGRLFLKPDQKHLVALMLCRNRIALEAAMGAGKTPMRLAYIWCRNIQRNLWVVPPHLQHSTIVSIREWGMVAEELSTWEQVWWLRKTMRKQWYWRHNKPLPLELCSSNDCSPEPKCNCIAQPCPHYPRFKQPQIYVCTYQFLTLGTHSVALYDPWTAIYYESTPNPAYDMAQKNGLPTKGIPRFLKTPKEVISTRYTAQKAAAGANVKGAVHNFSAHVKQCPNRPGMLGPFDTGFALFDVTCDDNVRRLCKNGSTYPSYAHFEPKAYEKLKRYKPVCGATADEGFTENGYCRACGHSMFQFIQFHVAAKMGKPIDVGQGVKQWPASKVIKKMFGSVTWDENQNCNNPSSLRGEAMRRIRAKNRCALSGTTVRGYVDEIFNSSNALLGNNNPNFPWATRQMARFRDRHCTYFVINRETYEQGAPRISPSITVKVPEASNLNLYWKWRSPFALVRDEASVLEQFELPPMKRFLIEVMMESDQLAQYSFTDEEMRLRIASCNDEYAKLGVASKFIWQLRDISNGLNKIKRAFKIATDHIANGERGIIVTSRQDYFRQIHDYLRASGVRHHLIDQSIEPVDRIHAIDAWIQSGAPILVSRTKLINEGLNNLVIASFIITTDWEYSPSYHGQMEGRIRRPGQSRETTAYYLVSTTTNTNRNLELIWADNAFYDEINRIYSQASKLSIEQRMAKLVIAKAWSLGGLAGKARWIAVSQLLEAMQSSRGHRALAEQIVKEVEQEQEH